MSYQTAKDKIVELMRDYVKSSKFKVVLDGDPLKVPQSLLPCIIVEKESGTESLGATGMDKSSSTIRIKVLMNKKDVFGKNGLVRSTQKEIEKYVEQRDDNGQYENWTVIGVLRKYFTLSNKVVENEIRTEYGLGTARSDTIIQEGHIIINTIENIEITNRQ